MIGRQIVCTVVLLLSTILSQSSCADEAQVPSRWAILTSAELQNVGFSDLLSVRLSELQGVRLVEREEIGRVLAELRLNASGLIDPAKAVRFGQLVSADAILYAERDANAKPSVFRLRLIETRTGVRFLDTLSETRDLEKLVGEAVAECQAAQTVLATKPEKRRFLGLLGITSEQSGDSLDAQRRSLETLLQVDLARLPGIVTLEREQLQHLTAERDLTGVELQLRASTYVVEGGLRKQYRPDRYLLTLKVTSLASGESRVVRASSDDGDLLSLRASALDEIARLWEKAPRPSRFNDTQAEAAKLVVRRRWLAANRRYAEAVSTAEAAFALSPNEENAFALRNICGRFVIHQPFFDLRDRLEVARRAHEVDIWRIEHWQASPGPERPLPNIVSLWPHVALKQDEPDSVGRAREEFERTRREKLAKVYRALVDRDLPIALLLVERLRFANYYAETPEEFCSAVLRLQRALERRMIDGPQPIPYHIFLTSLWYQATLNDHELETTIHPQHRWTVAQLAPLTEAFTQHRDPMIQMLGQHVLSGQDGQQGMAAASRCFELVFDPRLESRVISNRGVLPFLRGSLGRPIAVGNQAFFETCFEAVLARCEQAKDVTVLNRLPAELQIQLLTMATPEKRIDWYSRWMRLVEASNEPSQLKSTAALRRWAASDPVLREQSNRPSSTPSAVWDQYKFKELTIRSELVNAHVLGVGVDRRNRADGGQLLLVRSLLQQRSGLIIEEIQASGGVANGLNSGLPFTLQSIFGRSTVPIESNESSVFVWCGKRGLGIVRDGTETLVGEDSGMPQDFLGDMAWFEGRLYMSFRQVFLCYDPKTGKTEQLASSLAVESKTPLDGGKPFFIQTILPDAKRRCLWLLVEELIGRERHGVWRYSPDKGEFHFAYKVPRRVPGFRTGTTMSDLSWSGNELFFFEGRRWVVIDPETERAIPLEKYAKFDLRAEGVRHAVRFIKIGDHIIGANGQIYTPDGNVHRHGEYGGSLWHSFEPRAGGFIAGRKGQRNASVLIVTRQ